MASTFTNQPTLDHDLWGVPRIQVRLTESFDEIVAMNPELRVEQAANGEIVFMTPTGGESGYRNTELLAQLWLWARTFGGRVFDSSTLFCLSNGAKRSPDASWISLVRWQALSSEQRKAYPPISPDFVVELRSESDRLVDLQEKMQEYVENGVRLGWLIDPLRKQVHIYKPGQLPEVRSFIESVSGEDVWPDFMLDLRPIWTES
jgi:Uma2 family endonuclease